MSSGNIQTLKSVGRRFFVSKINFAILAMLMSCPITFRCERGYKWRVWRWIGIRFKDYLISWFSIFFWARKNKVRWQGTFSSDFWLLWWSWTCGRGVWIGWFVLQLWSGGFTTACFSLSNLDQPKLFSLTFCFFGSGRGFRNFPSHLTL